MRLLKLFPDDYRNYEGHRTVAVILIVLAVLSTARSLMHILLPDGGSSSIAGIDAAGGSAGALIFIFAWAGLYQPIRAFIQWIVILRYRRFIPLLTLLMLCEQIGLFLLPYFKPGLPGSRSHTPPEAIANKILLPGLAILFVFSLRKKRDIV